MSFPSVKNRQVPVDFRGGEISSNGGLMLIRQADRLTGLSNAVCRILEDGGEKGKVKHDALSMPRQRIYGLALGYEDLNGYDHLRSDLAFQTAAAMAYPLIETIRRVGLKGTKLAKAQCGTIRLKFLKIGAVIIKNTRWVKLMLASSFPPGDCKANS